MVKLVIYTVLPRFQICPELSHFAQKLFSQLWRGGRIKGGGGVTLHHMRPCSCCTKNWWLEVLKGGKGFY